MRKVTHFILSFQILCVLAAAQITTPENTGNSQPSVVLGNGDFDSQSLMAPQKSASSLSFLNPGRFSMNQSYSLSFAAGGAGSTSSGVYLNTLSYKLANPLTLSMDMGFYTPIHSNIPGMRQNSLSSPGAGTSLILPRMGLEYKPNDRFSLNLEIFNGQDAWKAYGGSPFSQSLWSRAP
jgi:hypothetical protein